MKKIRKNVTDAAVFAELLAMIAVRLDAEEETAANYLENAQTYGKAEFDDEGKEIDFIPDSYYLQCANEATAKAEAWERLLTKLSK